MKGSEVTHLSSSFTLCSHLCFSFSSHSTAFSLFLFVTLALFAAIPPLITLILLIA